MTYPQSLLYLEALRSRGIQPGLSRMQDAAERLGHPERAFAAVHITGTNGKGSTAAMIAAALNAVGQRTGLFTSPAVTDIRDTIQIDGQPISEDAFAAAATAVCEAFPDGLTEFEWLTTVCFVSFRQAGVKLAVVECGLGGRGDATNILPSPLCAVFTPIDLDHTHLLGSDIEAVAREKSGIIKPGCDVVCAPLLHADALGVLYEAAAQNGCCLWQPSPNAVLTVDEHPLVLTMKGVHQQHNTRTAHMVLERLQARGIAIDFDKALTRMATVSLPCRQELLETTPPLLLDGAHNAHGIAALCARLGEMAPVTLIIGMLADKDHEAVLQQLAPFCRRILCCTPPDTPRPAIEAKALAAVAACCHTDVAVIPDPIQAYESAKNAPDTTCIVAGGSFYTAAAIRRHILEG